MTTALKNKYGSSITLPSYDDILSKEVTEEYADTKSKAEFENNLKRIAVYRSPFSL